MRRGLLVPLVFGLGALAALVAAIGLVPERGDEDLELGPALQVCILDASASERRTRPDWSSWVRRELRTLAVRADEAGADLAVVRFADDVEVIGEPEPARRWIDRLDGRGGEAWVPVPTGAGLDSDLARALTLARAVCEETPRAGLAVDLLSSGLHAGENPSAGWADLAGLGARLTHHEPPVPTWPDLAIERAELPAMLEPDAPAAVRLSLAFEPGTLTPDEASVLVRTRQGGREELYFETLELPREATRWQHSILLTKLAYGALDVVVEARLVHGGERVDPVVENDLARATSFVEGERSLGLIREAKDAESAARWLLSTGESGFPGITIVPLEPRDLPHELANLDAIATFDVEPRELPYELLRPFVENGGGWLSTSGSRALRPAPDGEDWSDLACLERVRPEHDERDVILLVDGSGSMAGEPFEMVKAAGVSLAEAALAGDAVDLRFFSTVLESPIRIKERGEQSDVGARAARRLLSARVPSNSTYIAECLQALMREREHADRSALVLLLTDGEDHGGDPNVALVKEAFVRASAATDTRLVAIAVGENPRWGYLQGFLPEGEDVLFGNTLEELNAIFEREIEDERRRRTVPPVPVIQIEPGEFGVDAKSLAPLDSLWRTEPVPGATVVWRTDDGDPVLALKRVKSGRVVQLSTHLREGWAGAWLDRAGLAEPAAFAPFLRWLVRRPRSSAVPSVRRTQDGLELLGVPEDTPAIIEAELAPVDQPAVRRVTFTREAAPAGFSQARRRVARFSELGLWAEPGASDGLVLRLGALGAVLPLPPPDSPEFLARRRFQGESIVAGEPSSSSSHASGPLRAGATGLLAAGAALGLFVLGLLISLLQGRVKSGK